MKRFWYKIRNGMFVLFHPDFWDSPSDIDYFEELDEEICRLLDEGAEVSTSLSRDSMELGGLELTYNKYPEFFGNMMGFRPRGLTKLRLKNAVNREIERKNKERALARIDQARLKEMERMGLVDGIDDEYDPKKPLSPLGQ